MRVRFSQCRARPFGFAEVTLALVQDSKMQSQMTSQMQSQMALQGPYGSNMMSMQGSMIHPGTYAPSVVVRAPAICQCVHALPGWSQAWAVARMSACNLRPAVAVSRRCMESGADAEQICAMQSQSHNGSSFYPYDAQSDVASSVNGQNGAMGMQGGYGPGYGQFNQGYVQPQFHQGYGVNPFGQPSPEGWPGPGHNVQAQACTLRLRLLSLWVHCAAVALHIVLPCCETL